MPRVTSFSERAFWRGARAEVNGGGGGHKQHISQTLGVVVQFGRLRKPSPSGRRACARADALADDCAANYRMDATELEHYRSPWVLLD